MTTLQWRTASDLHLIAGIIPKPGDPSELLDRLTDVRIAVSGSVLYVDPAPAPGGEAADGAQVFAIPVASVLFLAYRQTPVQGNPI